MRSEPNIVPATEADLPGIAELAGVIWRACYPGVISTEQIEYMLTRMYAPETLRQEVRDQGIVFYRLLEEGWLAGFASLGPTETPAVMKLHKLYLRPELHGRGLGALLLRHCAGEARRAGARRLILAVNKRNTRAQAAYQRNGFVVVDAVVADIGGGFVMDDFVMAKELISE
jgi:GNAT superfamily N-acetyltransferase